MRSQILAANMPVRINVPAGCKVIPEGWNVPVGRTIPDGRYTPAASQSYVPTHKRDRPLASKDSHPRKRRNLAQTNSSPIHFMKLFRIMEASWKRRVSMEKWHNLRTRRSRSIMHAWIRFGNWSEIIIDDVFVFAVATEIMKSEDIEPHSVDECQRRIYWSK